MVYKFISICIVLMAMTGCALSSLKKTSYTQGYIQGITKEAEKIAEQLKNEEGSQYQWHEPLVQEVKVPAHVQDGMYIPAHTELVLLKPGTWALKTKESYESNPTCCADMADITSVPTQVMGGQ